VRIAGVLDDYVFAALACLDAWECTGEMRYYKAASEITESMLARFYDKTGDRRRIFRYADPAAA